MKNAPITGYILCFASDVPSSIRFDTPGRCAGQTIEISYGGPPGSPPNDEGAPYKRVIDRSDGSVLFYRRVPLKMPFRSGRLVP